MPATMRLILAFDRWIGSDFVALMIAVSPGPPVAKAAALRKNKGVGIRMRW